LRAARYLLDLALQPVGELKGFTRIDNIQGASLRYQLNFISYGLGKCILHYAPNFHGYLNQANGSQSIALRCRKCDGYWKLNMRWGRLSWNPDPIGTRDNVMLTGWSLIALSTYAANTGDLRYQRTGALKFRPSSSQRRLIRTTHTASHSRILWNWRESPYVFRCEPHWIFAICNILAMCGLIPYDRVNGNDPRKGVYDQFMRVSTRSFWRPMVASSPLSRASPDFIGSRRPHPCFRSGPNLSVACYGNAVHRELAGAHM
jgi:hypothetical protein